MRAIPFSKIKKAILGDSYDLSVAIISPAAMRRAMEYKKKKAEISNVLAFPLSKSSGEILLCKDAAKQYTIPYLFIHGLLHLKGFKHGATMEKSENKFLELFGYAKNSNRNRRRYPSGKSGNRAKKSR